MISLKWSTRSWKIISPTHLSYPTTYALLWPHFLLLSALPTQLWLLCCTSSQACFHLRALAYGLGQWLFPFALSIRYLYNKFPYFLCLCSNATFSMRPILVTIHFFLLHTPHILCSTFSFRNYHFIIYCLINSFIYYVYFLSFSLPSTIHIGLFKVFLVQA